MRPSTSATERARAVTLRMKVVAMKRSRSKYASPIKSSSQHPSPVKTASKAASPKKHTSPSPKKRKAGSNADSLKKRTSRRLNVTKSVSKSSNNSQQAQSDDAAQEEENLTSGLKLLKCGMVTMAQVTTTVICGQRIVVQLTAKGEPIGKEAGNMQSFIGVLARTKIPISIPDWRDVDEDEKHKIWESVQELRNEQVEKRKKNKYNHRLSRKGYRGMRAEMAVTLSPEELEELGRYWIKARQDKDGKFLDVAVEEAVERIVNLQKMEVEGKFKSQGMKDVLTEALGNLEHRGKVRGVGGNVKPETYFDLPRRQKGRKKVSEEERESLFAKEKAKWEEEMKKKQAEVLAKAEAKWEKKFAMLEAKLEGKLLASETPQTVTTVNNDVGSRQGSCSRPWEQVNHPGCQAVKKRLVLGGCTNGKDAAKEELQPADGKEVVLKNEHPADGRDGSILEDVSAPKESTNAEEAVDTVENIVAFGCIVDRDLDPNKQTIHGVPLGAENVRVSIVVSIIGHHLLPYPIKDEIMTVKDALGSIVAWPRNLVIKTATDMENKAKPKAIVTMTRRTRQQASSKDLDDEDLEHMPPNLPRQLLTLCTWANTELRNRATIFTTFPAEIFGHPTKAVIFRKDVHVMAHMTELTSSCIIFYISYLNEVLKKSQMTDMVGFVDPNHTSALGCGTPIEHSKNLMNRFKDGTNCQIYLVPHNSGGIKFYYARKMKKSSRVSVQWIPLLGIPEQKDGKTCAYLVMRYMKDIIADKDLEFSTTVCAFDAKVFILDFIYMFDLKFFVP
ncbi:hypothetical protein ACLB2K_020045 [Fragaria x ananassa]